MGGKFVFKFEWGFSALSASKGSSLEKCVGGCSLVGPTSPLSSRHFCVDYLREQGKWICERLSD